MISKKILFHLYSLQPEAVVSVVFRSFWKTDKLVKLNAMDTWFKKMFTAIVHVCNLDTNEKNCVKSRCSFLHLSNALSFKCLNMNVHLPKETIYDIRNMTTQYIWGSSWYGCTYFLPFSTNALTSYHVCKVFI